MHPRTLIAIPTYNERENLGPLYERIRQLSLETDLLVMDDGSPDGTGEVADRLAMRDPALHVVHRAGKLGIGSAHRDIIRWAYERGYERLVTMDCDFTHQPEVIPSFMSRANACDVVIGTRFVDPQSLKDWDPFRRTVTYVAHFLTKKLLGMPYDASGAFRLYRLDRIPAALFDLVTAKGYDFFFQSLFILAKNGFSIEEIPILLPARTCGHSKMTLSDAARGLSRLAATCLDSKLHRSRYILAEEKRIKAHERAFAAQSH